MLGRSYKTSILSGFLWGFFEGIFFFIVPDVLLCFWALKSWKHAAISTLSVLAGSMISACCIYLLLNSDHLFSEKLPAFWEFFPGFKIKMLDVAGEHINKAGGKGLIYGPLSGIPYRFYILQAWHLNISLEQVLFWTPLARIERIFLAPMVTLFVRVIMQWLFVDYGKKINQIQLKQALIFLIILYWMATYVWYWGFFLPATYG